MAINLDKVKKAVTPEEGALKAKKTKKVAAPVPAPVPAPVQKAPILSESRPGKVVIKNAEGRTLAFEHATACYMVTSQGGHLCYIQQGPNRVQTVCLQPGWIVDQQGGGA